MNKTIIKVIFLCVFLMSHIHARTFNAEGADLIMGVGPEDIGRSGAVVANTNDLFSIFWNPAGLSEIQNSQLIISKQLNGELSKINYIGFANTFYLEDYDLKLTLAFAYFPRLLIETNGTFYEDEAASIFSLYTLPGLSGNYTGKIDSVTDDYRFALAVAPIYNPKWSFGVSLGYVNCGTTFAGETMEDPGNYKTTNATADMVSLGAGYKYYANDNLTFGANVKNIDSKLDVKVTHKDDNGTEINHSKVDVPLDITLGINWKKDDKKINLAMDYQRLTGNYGGYDLDFQILRSAITYNTSDTRYHFGLLAPLRLHSSQIKKVDLPSPVLPTIGLGWDYNNVSLAFAVFAHPIASYTNNEIVMFSDFSIKYNF